MQPTRNAVTSCRITAVTSQLSHYHNPRGFIPSLYFVTKGWHLCDNCLSHTAVGLTAQQMLAGTVGITLQSPEVTLFPPLYYRRVKWLCGTLSQPGPPRVLIAAPLGKPPYPHGPTKHHYTPLQTVLTRAGELRRAKEVVCILLYLLLITTRRN